MESCCRACSRSDDFRRFSLYAVAEVSQEVIANMIRDTSDTQVSTEDGLPQHICPDCLMTLSLAYSFRKQCRRSEAKFREYWGRRTPAQSVDQQQQQHQQQNQQQNLPRRSQSQVPDDSSFEAVATNIKEEVDIYDYEYSVPSVHDNQWVIQNPRTIGEGAMTVVHNTGGQYYDEATTAGESAGATDREGQGMIHAMDDASEMGESSGLGLKAGDKLKKNVPNPERYSQRIRRQIEPDVECIDTVPNYAKHAKKPVPPYFRPPPPPTRGGLLVCSEKSKQMLDSIVNNQSKMMENQQKMMQMIVDTISNVQYLTQSFKSAASASAIAAAAVAGSSSSAPVPVSFTSDIMNPVNSVEELNALEELLKDDASMQQYVARLSFICGNSGRANGIDCCYKLIDHFITRPFLVQCSWTGNSRTSTSTDNGNQEPFLEMETGKVALKFYKRFRALFLNLIMLADSSFNEMECENFFKRIMKNSKQRVLSKMTTSKHRNRPKNLKYNIQKHNTGASSSSHASSMEVTETSASEPFNVESIFSPFERPN